jgi:hypothetical protein
VGLLRDHMTSEFKDLCQPRPIALAHQRLTGREMALLDAPMADVHRTGALLAIARWRQGTHSLTIVAKLGRMFFDAHDRIAPAVHNSLGHMPLGQQRLHRAYPVFQYDLPQHRLDLRDLIGLGIDGRLGQCQTHVVRESRPQVGPRGPLLLRAPQRLAIERHGGFVRCWVRSRPRSDALRPSSQLRFDVVAIDVPQDRVEGRRTGRVVAKAQGLRDMRALIASPCSDGTLTAVATQYGAACQGENRGEGMAFATRLAEVWHVGEDLDERTGLCYHEKQLVGKGFGSWGHAGHARPHGEQNPLPHFRLDLQPLSEN